MKRTEDSLRDLWNNIKCKNIRIIGVLEEEKKKGHEKSFEEYSWKFLQHRKGNSQSSPIGTKNPIKNKPKEKHARHILIKQTKTKYKEIILKVARKKQQLTYKESPICLAVALSAETLQTRRKWQDIFKVLKGLISKIYKLLRTQYQENKQTTQKVGKKKKKT